MYQLYLIEEIKNRHNLKSLAVIYTASIDIEFYLLSLLLAMLKPIHCLWILSIHSKLVCSPLNDQIVFIGLNVIFSHFVLHDILLHIPVRD